MGPGMAGAEPGGAARFSCPPNFAAIRPTSEPPHISLEALTGPDTELWLIRAPADFDPNCLNGRLVPLSGSQIVKGKLAGKRHRYRVLSSSGPQAEEATLLAPSAEAGGELTCAPAARGSLRIFEGPQETPPGTLQPIPASPPPQIPLGLRPRFCAFGGSPPITGPGSPLSLKTMTSEKREKKKQMPETSVPQEAVNGHGVLEVDPHDMSVRKKKKKKQQLQEAEVTEPTAEMLEPLGVLFPSTNKKRKKPKRTETVEPEMGMLKPEEKTVLGLVIKTEPLEEMVLPPTKKRKRQKGGTEGIEPMELMIAESQLQVKVEPQEEAIPLPSVKKKKEKGYEVIMEPEMRPVALHREVMEPEQPSEVEPQAQAALASTKKSRKKEKCPKAVMEPGTEEVRPQEEVAEPELPSDIKPQAAPASTKKKRKKERGHKVIEPGTEMIYPQEKMVEPELPDEGKLEAKPALASTKKRKKQDQESSQEEMPEPLLNLELVDLATAGQKKKRKKKLQQDPV
ncbi:DNA-directed RNA polymerase I subunit RPA34 [Tamandua tetradactyla]|uniref:DNA-directed RNA polymerase I subunit RPA34 n=1 Tax=Tamandua tetradactyla TaxID=48850 RepID=UPI0040540EE6